MGRYLLLGADSMQVSALKMYRILQTCDGLRRQRLRMPKLLIDIDTRSIEVSSLLFTRIG
jgi:hypothetical protein